MELLRNSMELHENSIELHRNSFLSAIFWELIGNLWLSLVSVGTIGRYIGRPALGRYTHVDRVSTTTRPTYRPRVDRKCLPSADRQCRPTLHPVVQYFFFSLEPVIDQIGIILFFKCFSINGEIRSAFKVRW